MAVSIDQIRDLLGSGLNNEVVATAVGCDPSYISQLLADENFAAEVSRLRMESLTANNKRDRSIDGLEDKLIAKLGDAIDSQLIYKPNDILRAFAVLNAAKRRGVSAHESLVINQQVVNLVLPTAVTTKFTIDNKGEVVQVDDQTMVTMPAHQLLQQLATEKVDDAERYKKVAAYLPGAAVEHGYGKFGDHLRAKQGSGNEG